MDHYAESLSWPHRNQRFLCRGIPCGCPCHGCPCHGCPGRGRWIFVCRLQGSTSFSSTPWPDPGESISTSSQTETLADIAENKTPPTIPYTEGSRASGRKGIRQRRIRLGAKEVSAYMAE